MLPNSTFDSFVQGKGAIYKNFWNARNQDLHEFSPQSIRSLSDYFNKQVFGLTAEEDEEEYIRQGDFNEAKWRELREKAEMEAEGGDEDENEDENGDEDEDENEKMDEA